MTAILLARRFGTSARIWRNLQMAHDLAVAERELAAKEIGGGPAIRVS